MNTKKATIKKALSIFGGIAVGILFAVPYFVFKEKIQSIAAIGYIGLFVSCLISNLSILLPTSSTIIVVAAASTLNPWICIIVGGMGTAFGEQASYLCGFVGASAFDEKEKLGEKALRWFDKNSFLTVFLFAFVPLPIFDVIGIIAGTKRMTWWKYTVAAVFGKIFKFLFVIVSLFYILPYMLDKLPGGIGQPYKKYLEQFFTKMN